MFWKNIAFIFTGHLKMRTLFNIYENVGTHISNFTVSCTSPTEAFNIFNMGGYRISMDGYQLRY
jgi:hypothetical protein